MEEAMLRLVLIQMFVQEVLQNEDDNDDTMLLVIMMIIILYNDNKDT